MKLYNFLTDQKEEITKNSINWYCCGPTVHAVTHMGHARTFSIFDSMRKFMTSIGIRVNFGMNITDIDDKINNKVKEIHKSLSPECLTPPMSLYYNFVDEKTKKFWNTLKRINIYYPTKVICVSEVIKDNTIEKFIDKLIIGGYAYESNGSVYFDTTNYEEKFGKCPLSNSTEDDVNIKDGYATEKRNIKDFALWKKSKENFISFDSKWGKGTPGWHIECSVMSNIMFGDNIDLHSGGIDLKFPHHHNEVLQSNSYHQKLDVFKHFIYTGHICTNNEKMAQSMGNYITVDDYLAAHSPNSLRLLFWLVPWDKPMNLTDKLIEQAEILEKRINEFLSTINFFLKLSDSNGIVMERDVDILLDILDEINLKLHDNFSVDDVIRLINKLITESNKVMNGNKLLDSVFLNHLLVSFKNLLYIIGFDIEPSMETYETQMINKILEIRDEVRKNKLYDLSDHIRNKIIPDLGYVMQDTPNGTKIEKIN